MLYIVQEYPALFRNILLWKVHNLCDKQIDAQFTKLNLVNFWK